MNDTHRKTDTMNETATGRTDGEHTVIVCMNRQDRTDTRVYRTFEDVPDEIMDDDERWYVLRARVRTTNEGTEG